MNEWCEGQALEFWFFIVASQASPVWLSSTANEQMPPIELHATSPLICYEDDIILPTPFVSRKPTPKQHHLPLPFSFLPNLLPVFY